MSMTWWQERKASVQIRIQFIHGYKHSVLNCFMNSLGSKYADQWIKKKQFIQTGSQTLEIANVIGYNMTVTN